MQRRVPSALDIDARTPPTPINFQVPPGACDCHVHVFCDPRQFPFSPDRPYTPPPAPVEDLRRVLHALHMDRAVIVSPAVYGASNDCTLDAIHRLGSAGRGIALIAPQTSRTPACFMGSNQVARECAGAAARSVLSSPTRTVAGGGRHVTPDEAAMERAYNLTARQWEAWMGEAYRPSYSVAPCRPRTD